MDEHVELQLSTLSKRVQNAEETYKKQQKQLVPLIAQELKRLKKQLSNLVVSASLPLYKLIPQRKQLERKIEIKEKELHKYTDSKFIEEFKSEMNFETLVKEEEELEDKVILTEPKVPENSWGQLMQEPNTTEVKLTEASTLVSSTLSNKKLGLTAKDLKQLNQAVLDRVKEYVDDMTLSTDDLDHLNEAYGTAQAFMDDYLSKKRCIENSKTRKILRQLKATRLKDDDLVLNEDEYKMLNRTAKINSGKQFCKTCKTIFFCAPHESKLICKGCGASETYSDMNSAAMMFTTDVDDTQMQCTASTHLMDVIEKFRPREMEEILEKVMDDMKALLRHNRWGFAKDFTVNRTFTCLQQKGYNQIYDQKYEITQRLNGSRLPITTQIQEWKVTFAYLNLQDAAESVKDTDLSKQLKYELKLYYIFRMLGYHEFCPHFQLLTVPDKFRNQLRQFDKTLKASNIDYIPQMY